MGELFTLESIPKIPTLSGMRFFLSAILTLALSVSCMGEVLRISKVTQEDDELVDRMKFEDSELLVLKHVIISEKDIEIAQKSPGNDQEIAVRLTKAGGKKFSEATSKMRRFQDRMALIINGKLVAAPVIMGTLQRDFVLSGLGHLEATEFEKLLKNLNNKSPEKPKKETAPASKKD